MDKLIKKAEGLFKTDIKYLISGGSWLGGSQFITSATAFILSIAFANLLSPDAFGIYKYVLSITSLLLIPTLTGIDSAVAQAVARGFEGTYKTGLKTKMSWGVLGSVGSIGLSIYYFISSNMFLSVSFLIVSVFIPFIESFDLYNSFLQGKKLFKQFAKWNAIKKILSTLALIVTIFLTQNLFIIVLVYFLSTLIPNIIFYKKSKNYETNDKVDPTAISFGKHISLTHIFNVIVGELDKILVFQYLGGANLAIYTLATAPTDQIKALLKNLNTLAMPKFAEQDMGNIKKSLGQKTVILVISLVVIIAGYILLSPLFFKTFFPKYLASIAYSQVLAVSLIGAITGTFFYTILEAKKNTKGIYYYNILGNITNIIILFPMVYFFGLWGAVLARMLGRLFSMSLGYFLVKRI